MKFVPATLGSLKSLIITVTLAWELFAQSRPGPAASSAASIFGSYGLYFGLLSIGILVAVAIKIFNKKAVDKPRQVVSQGGVRRTHKTDPRSKKRSSNSTDRESTMAAYSPSPAKTVFGTLPINTFVRLRRTNPFLQLSGSLDPALTEAIEKTSEDSDCDLAERTKALQVLLSYRTLNSIAAIAQMALYDLSSKLRAEAVSALAELDHESVFETVLTACADPSREVRAAAARAYVNIGFDRSQAWTRIIESRDMGRMRHAARCAIEGDLVARSFDRLVHTDRSIAYEAYTLTALLIRSGESEPIYKALASHRDENVKLALLHVLQTIKEDSTPEQLEDLINRVAFTPDVAAKLDEVRGASQLAHA